MPIWSVHVSFVVFCVGVPVFYAYRTSSFFKTILTAWSSIIGWFFVMGFFVSPLVGDDPRMSEIVPDGPAVAGALFMGWLPSVGIATVAMVVARIIEGFVPRKNITLEVTGAEGKGTAE